ncbi:MAG: hypothetical protein JSC189_001043 [Candidatus Tokpelaia sp. JSC189]|nr:MAG: hypothetical protein JSC189_001043 [Candidatus Tokpelaia sp. JSC189]
MPEKNVPPDWFIAIVSSLWVGLAGIAGALVRQVNGPQKTWAHRIMEWIAGALCAIYITPVAAPVIHHTLERFDMISNTTGLTPETVTGLTGFLSGALGITILECFIAWIKNRLN